jgi:hypothetical protein
MGEKNPAASKTVWINAILGAIGVWLPQVLEWLQGAGALDIAAQIGGPKAVLALQVAIVALTALNLILRFATKRGVSVAALVAGLAVAAKRLRELLAKPAK